MKKVIGKSIKDVGKLYNLHEKKKTKRLTTDIKRGYYILTGKHTLLNEEKPDRKTTEIEKLTQIVYNSIIQSYLGGKTQYSPIEFEAGIRWFVSEGIKTLPQKILNNFYEYAPEDFVEHLPTRIIDVIYPSSNIHSAEKTSIANIVQNSTGSIEPINKRYIVVKKFKK